MGKLTDRQVKIILYAFIVLYAAVVITGWAVHRLFLFLAVLNAVSGLLLVTAWCLKTMRLPQKLMGPREMFLIALEITGIIFSVFSMFTSRYHTLFSAVQYSIFSIHSIVLVLLLTFMLTFKMKKLL